MYRDDISAQGLNALQHGPCQAAEEVVAADLVLSEYEVKEVRANFARKDGLILKENNTLLM